MIPYDVIQQSMSDVIDLKNEPKLDARPKPDKVQFAESIFSISA